MEDNLDAVGAFVEELAATEVGKDWVDGIVDDVVGADWRQGVAH